MLNGKYVTYGTTTNNYASTTQKCQISQRESIKTTSSYILNPEGRVNNCHTKPQPGKESQLSNAQNARRQVKIASRFTMAMKNKSQIDSIALCKPQNAFISTHKQFNYGMRSMTMPWRKTTMQCILHRAGISYL